MNGHGGHAEAGIPLVGGKDETAGVGADEICAGDASLSLHVFFPQKDAGLAGDGFRIVVVFAADAFAEKGFRDVAAVQVYDRLDDVGGFVAVELDDEFAEVGLQAFDAVFDEEGVEVDFLGRHRVGFRELCDAVLAEDGKDRLARVLVGGGKVDVDAAVGEGFLGLRQIVAEVVEGVVLDGGGEFAQRVGIRVVLVKDVVAFVGALGRAVDDRMLLLVRDIAGVLVDGLDADHESEFLRI